MITPLVTSASFFRRFFALFYDSFIVFSWLIVLTTVALIANQGNSLLPHRIPFLAFLVIGTGLFVSWFWHKRGQTLGMLAWKIKIVDQNHQGLSWPHAFLRYFVALLTLSAGGIGLWWCFIDKDNQSLYDRLTKTKLISLKAPFFVR